MSASSATPGAISGPTGQAAGVVCARITSGLSATSSDASLAIAGGPAIVNRGSGPVSPSNFSEPLGEGLLEGLPLRIRRGEPHQHANASHPLDWLRPSCERPRCRRAAGNERDESRRLMCSLHANSPVPPCNVFRPELCCLPAHFAVQPSRAAHVSCGSKASEAIGAGGRSMSAVPPIASKFCAPQ